MFACKHAHICHGHGFSITFIMLNFICWLALNTKFCWRWRESYLKFKNQVSKHLDTAQGFIIWRQWVSVHNFMRHRQVNNSICLFSNMWIMHVWICSICWCISVSVYDLLLLRSPEANQTLDQSSTSAGTGRKPKQPVYYEFHYYVFLQPCDSKHWAR